MFMRYNVFSEKIDNFNVKIFQVNKTIALGRKF